jgi:phospholipid/cholesterol/gamma-HCH transport system substrate-binding protein
MKGKNLLNRSNFYYAEYQNIDELSATSPVLIRGLRIGTVSEVKLKDDMTTIVATLDIDRGIRFPKNTEALIINTSIMGGKAVVLDVKASCSGDDCAQRGDYLKGRVQGMLESMFADQDIPGYMQQLKSGLGDIVTDISDSLSAQGASNEFAKTFRALQEVLVNLASFTAQLSGSMSAYDRKLQSSLDNLSTFTDALAASDAQITSALANLDTITGDFKNAQLGTSLNTTMTSFDETLAKVDKSFNELEGLLKEINSGQGTLGKLSKDKELYDNLNETSAQLALLLQDFRLNPKRYVNVSVFGKKQKEYEVPEDDPALED